MFWKIYSVFSATRSDEIRSDENDFSVAVFVEIMRVCVYGIMTIVKCQYVVNLNIITMYPVCQNMIHPYLESMCFRHQTASIFLFLLFDSIHRKDDF